MKLKKLTALLLGVTMTVTMLAGCGGAAKTDDSSIYNRDYNRVF